MNPARLFVLAGLLLAAAALGTLLLLQTPAEGPPPIEAASDPLLPGDPSAVKAVTVLYPGLGRRIRLESRPDRFRPWEMTEPLVDRAEPVVARELLRRLFGSDWRQPPGEWAGRPDAQLGLDPPRMVVRVEFETGDEAVLKVGAPAAHGGGHAALRNGTRTELGLATVRFLERPPADWRDHRLLALGSAATRVRWLPAAGTGFVLENRLGHWYFVEPLSAPLDPNAESGLKQMLGARSEVLSEDVLLPDQRAQLESSGRLVVSAGAEEETLFMRGDYALAPGRPFLLHRPVHAFGFLKRPLDSLVSARLLVFRPAEVASLFLRAGEREVHVRRVRIPGGGAWQPAGRPVLGRQEEQVLNRLIEIACTAERGAMQPLPEREADGEIRLSRSHGDTHRGTQALLWWVLPGERSQLVASEGAAEGVLLDENLDRAVRDLLSRF